MLECGKKGHWFVFMSKVAFPLKKCVCYHVLSFRELLVTFVEEKSEKHFGQLKVFPKISHSSLLVK